MNETILIIGANGFIGRNLADYCNCKGLNVIGVDTVDSESNALKSFHKIDATTDQLDDVLSFWRPNFTINLAGNADISNSFNRPGVDFRLGPCLQENLLESVRKLSLKTKIIFTSSAAVYGEPISLPVNEGSKIEPISPYGYHKWIGEILVEEYVKIYSINANIVRIFSAYGEGLKDR